ncbi:LuxR family transcriptional regulator [Aquimarina sp. AD10]|uniref:response regulator transcription factor n=1 Tax=Aquimarina sp. AD10 TaxID=1714849 RepID=UPI000E4EE752|nr:LuxR C-terminal-related transcriptional regulator [Aquimarina sp. AD10]AXT62841.1 LuxR family transcriptional regulator [Aquimarina sp. AD10]RKN02025.1 LuxR family transcriptional regulator [Aquimarina sp. AD10]
MKLYCYLFCIFLFASQKTLVAQYDFSGYVDTQHWSGDVYLSLIEDYRKLSGVYPEQIIQKTTSDSLGYFSFSGDNLPPENRMYRIHMENCSEDEKDAIHFNGFCPDSKEILFIANNHDSLTLPFSFDKEMFCKIVSNNQKSDAFIKVDSIIHEMRFAFASYRSETNRKLNVKKWFSTLQQYVQNQDEPLTELYIYAFLSDKANNLYAYYLEDLNTNPYYDQLLQRLQTKYPNNIYTNRYKAELASDKFLINSGENAPKNYWLWALFIVLISSIAINILQFSQARARNKIAKDLSKNLTQQEQKVLNFILEDKTNKEIASSMFVSISTIKTHINNLYKKLNVRSREEVKSLYINK